MIRTDAAPGTRLLALVLPSPPAVLGSIGPRGGSRAGRRLLRCRPSRAMLDTLGALVKDGHLEVEADLHGGQRAGDPEVHARGAGRSADERSRRRRSTASSRRCTSASRTEGSSCAARACGRRSRSSRSTSRIAKGITDLKFHGLGIWKPIVAIFGGIARSAVRKLELRTDIPSVMKGEILGGKKPARLRPPRPRRRRRPTRPSAGVRAAARADAVVHGPRPRGAHRRDGRDGVSADRPVSSAALRRLLHGRAARVGDAVKVDGREGRLPSGTRRRAALRRVRRAHRRRDRERRDAVRARTAARSRRGRIRGAAPTRRRPDDDGKLATALSADEPLLRALLGQVRRARAAWASRSTRARRSRSTQVKVTSDGQFSGVAKLDLAGKTGELSRKGATISASDIKLTDARPDDRGRARRRGRSRSRSTTSSSTRSS